MGTGRLANSPSARGHFLVGQGTIDIDPHRQRVREVMLRKESGEHFFGQTVARVARKLRLVADVPSAAHHREVHAEHAALLDDDDDIDVLALAAFDVLLVLYLAQD